MRFHLSKILPANCESEEVTIEGQQVEASILSEGIGASNGVALIDKEQVTYITSNATDIKTTLEKLTESLDKAVLIFTSIGAGMTGPTTAPPPTLAVDLAEITAISTELKALKDELK